MTIINVLLCSTSVSISTSSSWVRFVPITLLIVVHPGNVSGNYQTDQWYFVEYQYYDFTRVICVSRHAIKTKQ